MPKMKTRRSAAKRYILSASGKVRRSKCGRRHLLESKNRKVKRTSKGLTEVMPALAKKIRLMLYNL
ncbi:MAG: 50S ribosomal protein L35 [Brevinema sp.]